MRLSSQNIKAQSINAIFNVLHENETVTRGELSKETGLSLMTVSKIVDILMENRLLLEKKEDTASVGRKASLLKINKEAKKIVILDLTDRTFIFNILNLDLSSSSGAFRWYYHENEAYETNLRGFLSEAKQALEKENLEPSDCMGIGISVPGPYYEEDDRILNKRIPEMMKVRLKSTVKEYFPESQIFIDEDVKLAARYNAEMIPGFANKVVFYAYVGVGIGGSIIVNGNILRGGFSFAGDFGQFRVHSGQTLEELISVQAFAKRLLWDKYRDDNNLPFKKLAELCQLDEKARLEIALVIQYLAEALYNVSWLIDPDTIIIETDYSYIDQGFIENLNQCFKSMFETGRYGLVPEIVSSTHSIRDAYKGAGLILRERWLSSL